MSMRNIQKDNDVLFNPNIFKPLVKHGISPPHVDYVVWKYLMLHSDASSLRLFRVVEFGSSLQHEILSVPSI